MDGVIMSRWKGLVGPKLGNLIGPTNDAFAKHNLRELMDGIIKSGLKGVRDQSLVIPIGQTTMP